MARTTTLDTKHPPDIAIVGAGLKQYAQLTLEAIAMLRTARVIFHSGFNGDLGALSVRWNPAATVCNLDEPEYAVGTYRPDMYVRMASVVVGEASRGPGVVVLQPGSAVVVDSVTEGILKSAAERGLSVAIMPGVSCIEAVLGEVAYDAGAGVQVVQAQKLVLHRYALNPALAAVIIQPGYYDTRWWAGIGRSTAARFVALHDHLRTVYRADAEMAFVLSPIQPGQPGSVFWFVLGDMPALHRLISPFHTLFIPPAADTDVDEAFLQRIDSWDAVIASFERGPDGRPVIEQFARAWDPNAVELPADLIVRAERIAAQWARRRQSDGRVPSRNSPTSPSA